MKTRARKTTSGLTRGRISCAGRALVALLMLALLVCAGCDDSIRETVRQGAYGVFDDAMDTFYTELGSEVTSGIQSLGSSTDTSTDSTTDSTASDSGGTE